MNSNLIPKQRYFWGKSIKGKERIVSGYEIRVKRNAKPACLTGRQVTRNIFSIRNP